MWNQTIFSKKNRNLNTGGQLMDGYQCLTDWQDNAVSNSVLRDLRARARRHHQPLMAFIHKSDEGLFIGLIGKIEAILGEQHEFAREAIVSRFSGPGREIAFNHAYHCPASADQKIPDLATLCKQQRGDLLHVLTEAHAGREPVPMEPVAFAPQRIAGTDWDRVAAEVEAGKCQGGFFSMDGKLIERFEAISENVTKEAKTLKNSLPSGNLVSPKGSSLMITTALTIGAAIAGWAAWTLIERDKQQHQSSDKRSRA